MSRALTTPATLTTDESSGEGPPDVKGEAPSAVAKQDRQPPEKKTDGISHEDEDLVATTAAASTDGLAEVEIIGEEHWKEDHDLKVDKGVTAATDSSKLSTLSKTSGITTVGGKPPKSKESKEDSVAPAVTPDSAIAMQSLNSVEVTTGKAHPMEPQKNEVGLEISYVPTTTKPKTVVDGEGSGEEAAGDSLSGKKSTKGNLVITVTTATDATEIGEASTASPHQGIRVEERGEKGSLASRIDGGSRTSEGPTNGRKDLTSAEPIDGDNEPIDSDKVGLEITHDGATAAEVGLEIGPIERTTPIPHKPTVVTETEPESGSEGVIDGQPPRKATTVPSEGTSTVSGKKEVNPVEGTEGSGESTTSLLFTTKSSAGSSTTAQPDLVLTMDRTTTQPDLVLSMGTEAARVPTGSATEKGAVTNASTSPPSKHGVSAEATASKLI